MADLPVMLRVADRRCVIVGGGAVALRRAQALLQAGAKVTVIAPRIAADLASLPVATEPRAYRSGDLEGAFLVVVATDDPQVNRQIAQDAQAGSILINRTDDPGNGDFTVPAHARHGPVTLAVHTSGISATAAAAIRRELSQALDPDWPRLLEIVAPFRALIQARMTDPAVRQERLARLTDAQALATLKHDGPEAAKQRCQTLLETPSASQETQA